MSFKFPSRWYFQSRTRDFRTCYVGLSVGRSATNTKCERFLAIPLLPTRPRGGVNTALFIADPTFGNDIVAPRDLFFF